MLSPLTRKGGASLQSATDLIQAANVDHVAATSCVAQRLQGSRKRMIPTGYEARSIETLLHVPVLVAVLAAGTVEPHDHSQERLLLQGSGRPAERRFLEAFDIELQQRGLLVFERGIQRHHWHLHHVGSSLLRTRRDVVHGVQTRSEDQSTRLGRDPAHFGPDAIFNRVQADVPAERCGPPAANLHHPAASSATPTSSAGPGAGTAAPAPNSTRAHAEDRMNLAVGIGGSSTGRLLLPHTDGPSRIAPHDGPGWHVAEDTRSRSDHCPLVHSNARPHKASAATQAPLSIAMGLGTSLKPGSL